MPRWTPARTVPRPARGSAWTPGKTRPPGPSGYRTLTEAEARSNFRPCWVWVEATWKNALAPRLRLCCQSGLTPRRARLPTWFSPKPGPGWQDAGYPRPQRFGQGKTRARSGSQPTPAPCSVRSIRKWTACSKNRAANRSVVVRKGRENYLCLLNLQETGRRAVCRTGIASGWSSQRVGLNAAAAVTWLAATLCVADRPVRTGYNRSDGPARRMPLFGLSALRQMRNREEHPQCAQRPLGDRQPAGA